MVAFELRFWVKESLCVQLHVIHRLYYALVAVFVPPLLHTCTIDFICLNVIGWMREYWSFDNTTNVHPAALSVTCVYHSFSHCCPCDLLLRSLV